MHFLLQNYNLHEDKVCVVMWVMPIPRENAIIIKYKNESENQQEQKIALSK